MENQTQQSESFHPFLASIAWHVVMVIILSVGSFIFAGYVLRNSGMGGLAFEPFIFLSPLFFIFVQCVIHDLWIGKTKNNRQVLQRFGVELIGVCILFGAIYLACLPSIHHDKLVNQQEQQTLQARAARLSSARKMLAQATKIGDCMAIADLTKFSYSTLEKELWQTCATKTVVTTDDVATCQAQEALIVKNRGMSGIFYSCKAPR